MANLQKLINLLLILVAALYPLVVFFGLQYFSLTQVSFVLLTMLVLRFAILKNKSGLHFVILLLASLLIVFSLLQQNALGIKLYPVVVNIALFIAFAYSLVVPPSIIERLARITEPDLPPHAVSYTRKVTIVWCIFFSVNAAIAAYTVFYASDEVWTVYNGLIAYCLMGVLFGVEWLVRKRVKQRYE